jgi:3',5'-cyclic AMP phosphodiesterase CpdA
MRSCTAAPLALRSANHASRLDAVVPKVAGNCPGQHNRKLQVGINTVPARTTHNFPPADIKVTHNVHSSPPFSSWKAGNCSFGPSSLDRHFDQQRRVQSLWQPQSCGRLPPGDVLIHAGDLTNKGSKSEVGCCGAFDVIFLYSAAC